MSTRIAVRIILWLWFIAALLAGRALLLQRLAPPAVPALVFGLAGFVLYLYFRVPALRAWVDALDVRSLVLLHVTRFVGIYFLILYRRGELPHDFAVNGGIGDIVVATLALPVALAPLSAATRQRALMIWNVVGLIDILLVAATAARLNLENPAQMRALTHLPLSLLPTFLVPLIIATHVVIFVRLARAQRPA
ncbi:MAG: hypothetical protein HZA93_02090 [Verrucomicrobia bacterium]|nr:hypothetical protein [Verrucomicrobiota bacterium]